MDCIDLPVVADDDMLDTVVNRMRSVHRGAVVVSVGQTHSVIELGDVVHAQHLRGDNIDMAEVLVLRSSPPPSSDGTHPLRITSGGGLTLLSVNGANAKVQTEHEWQVGRLSSVILGRCQANGDLVRPEDANPPGHCPRDGSLVIWMP